MVIACSDSRVDPSQIFDAAPGEMFVVRNVAAMVPPFETGGGHHGVSAALEFAVTQLEVREIVVMGHGACGGVQCGALPGVSHRREPGEGGFIADWIVAARRCAGAGRARTWRGCRSRRARWSEAVKVSLANLRTFPFVPIREGSGPAQAARRLFRDHRRPAAPARRAERRSSRPGLIRNGSVPWPFSWPEFVAERPQC